MQPGKLLHLLSYGFGVREHPLGQWKERFAGGGECDVAPGTMKEFGSEVLFKSGNLAAQGGLCQVKLGGSSREMAGPGNFDKTLQLFQVHVDSIYASI